MPSSKLTQLQRLAIAGDTRPQREIAAAYGISQPAVGKIKGKAIIQPNSYSVGDAVEFLRRLGRQGVDIGVVATSPPYNHGLRPRNGSTNWQASKLAQQGYPADNDNLPRAEYVRRQRAFLDAALKLVGDGGVICYQHKPVHRKLQVNLQQDILDGYPLRQLIIWDRGSSNNHDSSLYPPSYEFVAIIAGKRWRLTGDSYDAARQWGAVWKIPPASGNDHEAPFPLELARRMVLAGNGRAVADPYAGSGTVGHAAAALGIDFYLNDISRRYAYDFSERS